MGLGLEVVGWGRRLAARPGQAQRPAAPPPPARAPRAAMADAPLKSDAIKASGGPALTNRSKFITDAQGRTWFQESSDMWAGCAMTLEVKEVLHEEKTQYQDLMVFQSTTFGKVLLLDGVIQLTDRDEASYQEMIAHLPLCALRRAPRRVCVIGGGDGGVVREICRHASVESVDHCEIDEAVPRVSQKFFPEVGCCFDDPRVTLHLGDGVAFLRQAAEGTYDAIIVDSSDPVGPAAELFEQPFYATMHRALAPGGIVCTQAESLWLHLPLIKPLAEACKKTFAGGSVSYAYTTIPTYPSGQIGFMLCSKADPEAEGKANLREPQRPGPVGGHERKGDDFGKAGNALRYYNSDVHRAAFVLPQFAAEELKDLD